MSHVAPSIRLWGQINQKNRSDLPLLVMGYTADRQPHVGPVPNRPNQYILAGFNGHGMPVIYLAAKGIVEMIADGKAYEETGLPRVYRTSAERLHDWGDEDFEEKL